MRFKQFAFQGVISRCQDLQAVFSFNNYLDLSMFVMFCCQMSMLDMREVRKGCDNAKIGLFWRRLPSVGIYTFVSVGGFSGAIWGISCFTGRLF